MSKAVRYVIIVIICFAFSSIFCSCALRTHTIPNPVYPGPYPPGFKDFQIRNPVFAEEIGKLPELQDGLSAKEKSALQSLIKLYNRNSHDLDTAFTDMYSIGLPEYRKYLAPVQAFFWLLIDNKEKQAEEVCRNYSLAALLDAAWEFNLVVLDRETADAVIAGINNASVKRDYIDELKNNNFNRFQRILFLDYKIREEIFTGRTRNLIKNLVKQSNDNPRWQDFDTVTERLNAPELIDYYERKRFSYADWRTLPESVVTPRYVFRNNHGECVSITRFTLYCLRKGGYQAREIRVSPTDSQYSHHTVTLFDQRGEKYVMDNGRPYQVGIVPFEGSSYEESATYIWSRR